MATASNPVNYSRLTFDLPDILRDLYVEASENRNLPDAELLVRAMNTSHNALKSIFPLPSTSSPSAPTHLPNPTDLLHYWQQAIPQHVLAEAAATGRTMPRFPKHPSDSARTLFPMVVRMFAKTRCAWSPHKCSVHRCPYVTSFICLLCHKALSCTKHIEACLSHHICQPLSTTLSSVDEATLSLEPLSLSSDSRKVSTTAQAHLCRFCKAPATRKCTGCDTAYYCSLEHQQDDIFPHETPHFPYTEPPK